MTPVELAGLVVIVLVLIRVGLMIWGPRRR